MQIANARREVMSQALRSLRDEGNPFALDVGDEIGSNIDHRNRRALARAYVRQARRVGLTYIFTIQDSDGLRDFVESGDVRPYTAYKTPKDGGGYAFHFEPGLSDDCGAIRRGLEMTRGNRDYTAAHDLFRLAEEELRTRP